MKLTLLISRPFRPAIKATKQSDGSLVIRSGRAHLRLDAAELDELHAYARDKPRIQRFPVVPEGRLESPHADV
jgi:hypothetical protein